ncbi:MAG: HAMP domain-containing sensor histidine kinase, partial [Methylococcaceae bacterium]|nr:HAMP domain-containing sensor histidine kinase [Methylococcaceae bacterium]
VKYRLIVQAAVLLPISLVLLTIFVYVLHQPLRQMDHVIRTLGAGNFTHPIRVYGPRDLEFLGERLEWLRTRLNDLEMAKQGFMRNVSHEIKTPLATIHEGTDLLLDEVVGELNQEQRDIARILANSTKKLDALIVELIHYSQLNARMEYQKFVLVDMRQLMSSLIDEYQLQFRSKSITTAESLEAVEIMGSREQLHAIFDNLLSNATKYSPPGGEIRIGLRKEGGHMELEIEDDGPGIDPDERAHVFEPFFQGRAAREFGVKGTGFGLAIVAECVASHHGKVEVLGSAEDDAGARIRVRLPLS